MPSRWDAATHGWSRRVFHYPLPTLMSRNFRLPCTIELQPLSLTLLKMRKVEVGGCPKTPSPLVGEGWGEGSSPGYSTSSPRFTRLFLDTHQDTLRKGLPIGYLHPQSRSPLPLGELPVVSAARPKVSKKPPSPLVGEGWGEG